MRTKEAFPGVTWFPNAFPRSALLASWWIILVFVAGMIALGIASPRTDARVALIGVAAATFVGAFLDDRSTRVRELAISSDGLLLRHASRRVVRVPWDSVLSLEGPIPSYLVHIPTYVIEYRGPDGKAITRGLADAVGARVMEELERRFPHPTDGPDVNPASARQ